MKKCKCGVKILPSWKYCNKCDGTYRKINKKRYKEYQKRYQKIYREEKKKQNKIGGFIRDDSVLKDINTGGTNYNVATYYRRYFRGEITIEELRFNVEVQEKARKQLQKDGHI